jgi:hypothetical protein
MRLAIAKGKRIYFSNVVELRILCARNIKILVRGMVQPLVRLLLLRVVFLTPPPSLMMKV